MGFRSVFSSSRRLAGHQLGWKILYTCLIVSGLLLPIAMGSSIAYGSDVKLAWDPSGDSSVTGYKIYWGTQSKQYDLLADVGNSVSETISDLQAGTTYYFAAKAYSTGGDESDYSNEVAYTVPAGCTYSVTSETTTFTEAGGTGTINVVTQDTCSWTASTGASWATIASGDSGTGSGTVAFTVSPNDGTTSRATGLTVADQGVTLTQSGNQSYSLTLLKTGTGKGTISSNPGGTTFTPGTVVTLTASAALNSTFAGWSGCSGTGTTCQVTMNGNVSVSANFTALTYGLTITKSGDGNGSVSTKPSGTTFKPGATVTLRARPLTGSIFTGWSGACSGTSKTCKVKMTGDMSVYANFALKTYTMTASATDGGTISPSGQTSVTYGSTQTYTITPAEGYKLYHVRVDGRKKKTSSDVYTFSNVKAKHSIRAFFTKQ